MNSKTLQIKVALQIQKSAHEVFEAIVDPEKMSNYFISKSTGRMEEGKELTWWFPEFKEGSTIQVGKVEKDKYVSYSWDVEDKQMAVEIILEPYKDNSTIVRVTEKEMESNEAGLKWLAGNTEGWANFLACMKAYLEYGINLRKGAFEFMGDKK